MSTNYADDYADGIASGPSREEIEDEVLGFDDANNGYSAHVEFFGHGEYVIEVDAGGPLCVTFETLWEFQAWALHQELAADRELVSA